MSKWKTSDSTLGLLVWTELEDKRWCAAHELLL
jgi:hypothetical protein